MRTIILALVACTFFANPVLAGESYHWACFDRQGLEKVLDRVWTISQFMSLDVGQTMRHREFNKTGCAVVQIPSGSRASSDGFYTATFIDDDKSRHSKFIFAIYRVEYSTTGQRMWVSNSIYSTDYWQIAQNDACGLGEIGKCVTLKPGVSCEVVQNSIEYASNDWFKEYVLPRHCQNTFVIP